MLAGFTEALEDNSAQIVKALDELKKKELSAEDKKKLDKLGKELKSLDKDLDSLDNFGGK